MPRLQTDLVKAALLAEPAVEVVGAVPAAEAAEAAVATGAQIAILGDRLPQLALQLLAASPRLKVFGITESGRQAVLYECRPAVTRLGELSPRALLAAILDAARPGRGKAWQ